MFVEVWQVMARVWGWGEERARAEVQLWMTSGNPRVSAALLHLTPGGCEVVSWPALQDGLVGVRLRFGWERVEEVGEVLRRGFALDPGHPGDW